jgi:hypothetical protein
MEKFDGLKEQAGKFPQNVSSFESILQGRKLNEITAELVKIAESVSIKDWRHQWVDTVVQHLPPTIFECSWLESYIYHLIFNDGKIGEKLLGWYLLPRVGTHLFGVDDSHGFYTGMRRAYFSHRALEYLFHLRKEHTFSLEQMNFSLLLLDLVKRYPFLYWASSRVREYYWETLSGFCIRLKKNGRYSDNEWTQVERAIRGILVSMDHSMIDAIEAILEIHSDERTSCSNDQSVFSRGERTSRIATALNLLEKEKKKSIDLNTFAGILGKAKDCHGLVSISLLCPQVESGENSIGILLKSTDTRDSDLSACGLRISVYGAYWSKIDPTSLDSHNTLINHGLENGDYVCYDGLENGISTIHLSHPSDGSMFTWKPFGDQVKVTIGRKGAGDEEGEYQQILSFK